MKKVSKIICIVLTSILALILLAIAVITFIFRNVRVRRKKPCSASRKKPNFDKRKEPKLPELYLLFRVIQAVPLLERPLFF